MARTGRRPGQTETREQILSAARNQFGERGYDGTTIRGIAAEAGVNPALIHHFFGSKEQVFAAALELPINPADVLSTILDGPREEIGVRFLRLFLGLWRDPETRKPFLALIRSVSTNASAALTFRQFVERAMMARVTEALGVPALRLNALMAQIVGLAMARYILRVEPIASAEEDDIIATIAPVIQHYIDP